MHGDHLQCSDNNFSFPGKYEGKDSCNGDSGGPAVYWELSGMPWYQVGIVTYGDKNCASGQWPGFYTKVFEFLPWIKSKMKD